MRHKRMLPLAALLVALSPLPASAQKILDLAGPAADERDMEPGRPFQIVLVNLIPRLRGSYTVRVRREAVAVDPLSGAGFSGLSGLRGLKFEDPSRPRRDCSGPVERLTSRLDTASTERSVSRILATIPPEDRSECGARLEPLIDETQLALRDTFTLRPNQRLVVDVTRPGEEEDAEWRFVFATEPRGEWRLGYGFTFLPRVYPQYYTEQSEANPAEFVIRKESGSKRRDLTTNYDFIPSLLFTWLPSAGQYRSWNVGLTGGLGYDLTQTALFAGIAGTYNENITLTAGLAIHEQPRLAPQFTPGEVLKEDLDAAALHEDRFGPNVFFGVSFRLDRSPFGRREGEGEGEGEAGAGETRPDPENQAPGPNPGPAFNPTSITKGAKVGSEFEVEAVEPAGDVISVVFKLAGGQSSVELSGEYKKVNGVHCVTKPESTPTLPHVKEHPATQVCLTLPDALAPRLASVEENAPVKVKVDHFRVRWNTKTETAEYVEARVTEIVVPAAGGGS